MAILGRTADSQVQLVTSGSSIANGGIGTVSADLDNTVNNRYFCDFVLEINPGTAPNVNGVLELHYIVRGIQGSNDGVAPSLSFDQALTNFNAKNQTGSQFLYKWSIDVPKEIMAFYIKNKSGQATGTYNLWSTLWTPSDS